MGIAFGDSKKGGITFGDGKKGGLGFGDKKSFLPGGMLFFAYDRTGTPLADRVDRLYRFTPPSTVRLLHSFPAGVTDSVDGCARKDSNTLFITGYILGTFAGDIAELNLSTYAVSGSILTGAQGLGVVTGMAYDGRYLYAARKHHAENFIRIRITDSQDSFRRTKEIRFNQNATIIGMTILNGTLYALLPTLRMFKIIDINDIDFTNSNQQSVSGMQLGSNGMWSPVPSSTTVGGLSHDRTNLYVFAGNQVIPFDLSNNTFGTQESLAIAQNSTIQAAT